MGTGKKRTGVEEALVFQYLCGRLPVRENASGCMHVCVCVCVCVCMQVLGRGNVRISRYIGMLARNRFSCSLQNARLRVHVFR